MLKTVGNPSTRYGDQTILNGNLVIGTAGNGIDFSAAGQAAGMTSELLDDYEEGTWTPTGYNITLASANGRYVKIGRFVLLNFNLRLPVTADASALRLYSLPFAAGSGMSAAAGCTGYMSPPSPLAINMNMDSGSNFITFFKAAGGSVTNADMSNAFINGSMMYQSAT